MYFVYFVVQPSRAADYQLFARTNLVAWCIVPFDSKKRGPAERAEMVAKLGFTKVAYDWRAEHVPTFEQEILEYRKHKLEYFAFWSQHDEAYRLFAKHGLHPQIWVMMSSPAAPTNDERVRLAAAQLLPVVERTRKAGCPLTIYNHGGWAGEPENMIAVAKLLREQHGAAHVGVVYNLHHGHDHLDRFPAALAAMTPYLHCLNLNGMIREGDKKGQKILPLGAGDLDVKLLGIIRDSGYRGPIGIIGHTNDDAEQRLQDNLDGLDWLLPQLEGKPAGPKPKYRTHNAVRVAVGPAPPAPAPAGKPSLAPAFGNALSGGMLVEGKAEYRAPPLTIECRAKLNSKRAFNILVASDTKASAEHWELYSFAGSGFFSVYLPGRGGDFGSKVDIADGQWHALAAIIEPARVRLFVDGKLVRDAPVRPLNGAPKPGGLAFGRLVEGGIGCDGLIDDVRLTRGVREISGVADGPLKKDEQTIGLWDFDELSAATPAAAAVDYWAVEDAAASTGQPSLAPAFGNALSGGMLVEGKAEYRVPPLTIECRAKLNSKRAFNILVASDTKASAEHWELYSFGGSGFGVYLPGRGGNFSAAVDIADGQWHALAAVIEPARVRLFVDGKLVRAAPLRPLNGEPKPGGLAFGRLVEGGIGCDGLIDDVRLTRGVREIGGVADGPLKKDEGTIGLWDFDELTAAAPAPPPKDAVDYWAVEDATARARLPLYQVIPAAEAGELTPHNGFPKPDSYRSWTRSHGDGGSSRFSALTQINRSNVKSLQPAWTYHSKDGSGNIQCNPVIVGGVMFAPTVGQYVVAVDAATGVEKWRFKPEGRPAFRGLLWWPGRDGAGERLFFCAGKYLHALDPKTGQPVAGFGTAGRTVLPGPAPGGFGAATAGPAIFERTIVVPGFEKDVWAFDAVTGEPRWTFHTVPHAGEYGYETWDRTAANAANCWGGMAMDEQRGIAFITTGSPKPNFLGMGHRGDNLFANCLVALDARTGKRLWHFQEVRHDIWDLDLPAPPVLSTITREGRRVDVVAAVSKTGNTLLLDRVTGRPVFPFRLRRAPTSTVPGELTTAYQPDPELPQPFSRQEFTLADATTRTPEVREWALERLKSAQFGWFLPVSDRKVTIFYGVHGGAEWTGACTDPTTGRLYVSANEVPWFMSLVNWDEPKRDPKAPPTRGQQLYELTCAQCHATNRTGIGVAPPLRGLQHRLKDADVLALLKTGRGLMPVAPPMNEADTKALLDFLFTRDLPAAVANAPKVKPERPQYTQNGWNRFLDPDGYPACRPPWGTLNCLDLNTGKLLWKVPLGEHEELTRQGVPQTGTENFGGAMVTAGGLVFCAGTKDGKLRAFDSETGAELWAAKLPLGGYAPPATYEVNGRQFVVIAASGGGKLGGPTGDAYAAFALPGK